MRYYIIAGEASGDLHGSNLMRAILARDPKAEIRYWGGDRMAQVQGNTTQVKHIRDLAIMGFVEVLSHLGTVLGNLKFCKQDILQFQPDAIVFIDYPGFNLKIAQFTHQKGFKNYYYISPQVWAWKKRRIKNMRRDLDKLCYILPSEQAFYAQANFPQAVYVGHPLLDEVARQQKELPLGTLPQGRPIISLFPGSRKQEIEKMLPAMFALAKRHPEYNFVIAGMTLLGETTYQPILTEKLSNLQVLYDQTYQLLAHSFAAVVCSGTATLETAMFRVPQVVCYKANALTIAIARRIVKIQYISLVNIIANEPIVRELIQQDFSKSALEQEFHRITADKVYRERMLQGYDRVITLLGDSGASDRTAKEIMGI